MLSQAIFLALSIVCQITSTESFKLIDFEALGGIPETFDEKVAWHNGELMNTTLGSLKPGETLVVPNKTFYLMGGVKVVGLNSATFQLDGTLRFSKDIHSWPRTPSGKLIPAMYFENIANITFTSSGQGQWDGQVCKSLLQSLRLLYSVV